jgi:DNA-binding winged helix-turn-helix (wHTH) protein
VGNIMTSGTIHGGARLLQFGVFEVDLSTEELRRSGIKVRLQSQPFKLLAALLEQPGEVVSREELQRQLWGTATTVDFDHSLGIAVNKLRDALGDSAENPRFVETLARRGYRFIAPVQVMEPRAVAHEHASPVIFPQAGQAAGPAAGTPGIPPAWRRMWLPLASILSIAVVAAITVLLLRPVSHTPFQIRQVTYSGHVVTNDVDVQSFSSSASD